MITLVLSAAVSFAGVKDITYTGPVSATPIVAGEFDDMAKTPHCVRVDTRGMPTVQPCAPSIQALFSDEMCDGGFLCREKARPSELAPAWGIQSFDPADVGAEGDRTYLAMDHVFVRQASYTTVDATTLDEDALNALGEVCSEAGDRRVISTVHLGCGKTLRLDGYTPAEGKLKTRGGFDSTSSRGDGAFLTDAKGPDISSCAGVDAVMAVETVPLAEICASVIFPESLARLEASLMEFASEPEAIQEQRLSILMDLNLVQTGRKELLEDVDRTRDRLTTTRDSLGRSREEIEGLEGANDSNLLSLLTELERLTTDISETYVALSVIEQQAEALASEAQALEEKAAVSLDGVVSQSLEREVSSVLTRGRQLRATFRTERETISTVTRDVGFLQGRIAEVREGR